MTKVKKKTELDKIYIVVVSEGENEFFESFAEAETYAKDYCEKNEEDVQIFEICKAWDVYVPEEPQPEVSEASLSELISLN